MFQTVRAQEPAVDVLTFDKETTIYISAVIQNSDDGLQTIFFLLKTVKLTEVETWISWGFITLLKGSEVMWETQTVLVDFPWPDSHSQLSDFVINSWKNKSN